MWLCSSDPTCVETIERKSWSFCNRLRACLKMCYMWNRITGSQGKLYLPVFQNSITIGSGNHLSELQTMTSFIIHVADFNFLLLSFLTDLYIISIACDVHWRRNCRKLWFINNAALLISTVKTISNLKYQTHLAENWEMMVILWHWGNLLFLHVTWWWYSEDIFLYKNHKSYYMCQ